ncbi:MAG: hypothetical protein ACREAB_07140 [Blastocatellia bacterium]
MNELLNAIRAKNSRYFHRIGGVESIIAFLEEDPWTFGSGYAKADMVKLLRKLDLTPKQGERLRKVLLTIVDKRHRREFRLYCLLACKLDSPELRRELTRRLGSRDEGVSRRARWMLDYLIRNQA